jgi:hypothetical protein
VSFNEGLAMRLEVPVKDSIDVKLSTYTKRADVRLGELSILRNPFQDAEAWFTIKADSPLLPAERQGLLRLISQEFRCIHGVVEKFTCTSD